MIALALIQVRIDDEKKNEIDSLFSELGFDTPTAIKIFLNKSLEEQGLPFKVKKLLPNNKTVEAMKEAKLISNNTNTKRYKNFSELLSEVGKEFV